MKWIKDVFADARALLSAPIANVLCLAGVILMGAAFLDYSKASGLTIQGQFHRGPFMAGSILILLSAGALFVTNRLFPRTANLDYEKGIEIKRGPLTINIRTGEIQTIAANANNEAIVLPSNTTFVDDCATDKHTAMGAFFLERFPKEVSNLPGVFSEALGSKGLAPDSNGQYSPGTTIILPERFKTPAVVVITASSVRIPQVGISSSPYIICRCVEGILKCTADLRVDTIYVPILGSGHGGVDRGLALLFLLLACLHYGRSFHHVKNIRIVVHPKDVASLNESKELRQIIAL